MFEVFFTPSYLDWLANKNLTGGSPGLVVMGGDSRFKGREFESRHRILDGHFLTSGLGPLTPSQCDQ